ncbi:MAG: anthranilate synthase component I [Rhodospirillales bacterium]
MPTSTDKAVFLEKYIAGQPQVLWSQISADLETTVSAYLKLSAGKSDCFILESVEGGAIRGRYSFIGIEPDLIWRCRGNKAETNRDALTGGAFTPESMGALDSLRALIKESQIDDMPPGLPPMASSLVGYMGYDMVRLMETLPNTPEDTLGLPDGMFVRPTVMAVFDSVDDSISIVTPVRPSEKLNGEEAFEKALERIENAITRLNGPLPERPNFDATEITTERTSNFTKSEFLGVVERAKEYIRAGDAFQIVPAQRFETPFNRPPFDLYRALRRLNPSPFLFYLNFEGFAVVGSSPEILVRVRDGEVTIRPLAGTRRRGKNSQEDNALAENLLNDPKELAEHLMLLDLARNDVGRVSEVGSVQVTAQFEIERYSHVMHLSSTVVGQISQDYDEIGALIAGFPAGTVSGAPKVRAMEIIDELEPTKRGIYAGCIGYFASNGTMDTCIALRTGVVKDGTLYVQAGVGVVADSDPEAEFQESIDKSQALIRAAEAAHRL